MLEDLKNAPLESFVLLQMCGHNPTGFDPSVQEWTKINWMCRDRKLTPIFDTAYHGLASGDLDKDAAAPR